MSSAATTKQCRMCFSEIDARAKKCPHCQMLQGTWLLATLFVVAAIPLSLVLLAWFIMPHNSRNDDYSSTISVSKSKFYLAQSHYPAPSEVDTECPSVVGLLKNNGEHRLDFIEIQLQMFNESNELIDVCDSTVDGPFTPGEELAFKITGGPIHSPEAEYSSHKVIVRRAYYW